MEKFRQLFIDPIFNKDALESVPNCRVAPPTKALPAIVLDNLNPDQKFTIGKSQTLDYNGVNYYFFVNNPETDGVSRWMLSPEG